MMRNPSCGAWRCRVLAVLICLTIAPLASGQPGSFGILDYPEAKSSAAQGINDAGDVVGSYTDAAGKGHAFLMRGGKFTSIDYPGAVSTTAITVNNTGDIAGYYALADGIQHGFLLSAGSFTTVDVPGAKYSGVFGLNDKGEMVGHWQGEDKMKGFLFSDGKFNILDFPQANTMTCGFSINNSSVVMGHWRDTDGAIHGYLLKDGAYSRFDLPNVMHTMPDIGFLTPSGDIAGPYTDARGRVRSFLLRNGKAAFTPIDVPGSALTKVRGINASGEMVGYYTDPSGVSHGFRGSVAMTTRTQVIQVDDDGAECPGAMATIQDAVAAAGQGATILVCPGAYWGTVRLAGPEHDGLKLIAVGRQDEVVLQGDYTQRDGFLLDGVSNVLIRGFTVRDFGQAATTGSAWGDGHNILLRNADYNTIEHNRLINGDMVGIRLADSGHNTVQYNTVLIDNPALANCGIHINGAKTMHNVFRQNATYGNKMAGIMVSGAGPGNLLLDNVFTNNGRQGILNSNTPSTVIEGNRVSYNRGPWGTTPYAKELTDLGFGIDVVNSDKVSIIDNRLRNNSGGDVNWDGIGEIRFEANACDSSNRVGPCAK
jgi:parallel beta-helix repeat protein/probable HAF family extracellular repeat protein